MSCRNCLARNIMFCISNYSWFGNDDYPEGLHINEDKTKVHWFSDGLIQPPHAVQSATVFRSSVVEALLLAA